MELKDFRKADCTLFRLPPLDLSGVEEAITQTLLDAWQNQQSAGGVIGSITDNKKIINNLTAQISENLKFQRKAALEKIQRQEEASVASYETEQKKRIDFIEQKAGAESASMLDYIKRQNAELTARRKSYDATQASLEQTRERINQQLASMGNKKSIDAFVKMNEDLLGDEDPNKIAEKTNPERNSDSQISGSYSPVGYQTPAKKVSRGKRALKKIWEVLNYKIW
jgi:hypothetical protein